MRDYGKRFAYAWGNNEDEDLFAYCALFGAGILVWGIVFDHTFATPALADEACSVFEG